MILSVPKGDQKQRHMCQGCGFIDYQNPKMIVGCIVEHEDKVLLCKRAIEPCKGLWTVPAGFMELGETSMQGAQRETYEEAGARVFVSSPFVHFDIPVIGQSYLLFRANLLPPYTYSNGIESQEVKLYNIEDIPFEQLAFSSVSVALRSFLFF
eukprot:TRINITY_DN8116_c1_g1_i2.p2 TRINITY_DN8116_c1_g1~~TRINITY_DN8116_c1_g1_i2.p2  ORF type:complete len:153 (-),score=10.14 TRINITY_DN8116_c1_g1_i2:284-742(-)